MAVVGGGIVGLDHAAAYRAQSDVELVAIVGRDPARTRAVAERLGVAPWTDLEELVATERLDAVSVCTPTALHRPAVEAAATAGVHVLLEKPMATSVEDCDAIDRACRKAGVVLMLGFTHRFHAELLEARRRIAAGEIGPPGLAQDVFTFGEHGPWPDWYYDRALAGGGELMHDAVHMVDRLAWLIDSPIVEVYGRTTSYARGIRGVEDGGVATLAFANGAIGSIFVNEATYPSPGRPGRADAWTDGAGDPRPAGHDPLPDLARARDRCRGPADGPDRAGRRRHRDGGGDPRLRRRGAGRRRPPSGRQRAAGGSPSSSRSTNRSVEADRSSSTTCSRSRPTCRTDRGGRGD